MAKRDFKQSNPALAFISSKSEAVQAESKEEKLEAPAKAPEGYKLNPLYVETKSKRVNLLMQPSIVERMRKTAQAKGLSLNEAINEAVKEYLEREEV